MDASFSNCSEMSLLWERIWSAVILLPFSSSPVLAAAVVEADELDEKAAEVMADVEDSLNCSLSLRSNTLFKRNDSDNHSTEYTRHTPPDRNRFIRNFRKSSVSLNS